VPVGQSRRVTRVGNDIVVVIDRMESMGEHEYRLHWLLWDWPMREDSEGSGMLMYLPDGEVRVSAGISDGKTRFEWIRAEENGERGWHCRHYQELTPAISASWTGSGCSPTFWTVFSGRDVDWSVDAGAILIRQGEGLEVRIN